MPQSSRRAVWIIHQIFLACLILQLPLSAALAQSIDLVTTKSDSVDPILPGGSTVYTIAVTNDGTLPAPDVTVTDVLPSGVTFSGFIGISQGSAVFNATTANVMINFGTVAADSTATLSFRVTPILGFSSQPLLTIAAPPELARDYHIRQAVFAPSILGQHPVVPIVEANDGFNITNDACENLLAQNASALAGKIGIIRRSGACNIEIAAGRVAGAGAIAVIVVNPDISLALGGGPSITVEVPVVSMTKEDGDAIIAALQLGPVSGNLELLEGQVLNTVRANTSGTDINSANNLALQYTTIINDRDNDGVFDFDDTCPDLRGGSQDDFDGDGSGDICDSCTDSDSDGYGDPGFPISTCALDGCIADPKKSSPGACGCGTADEDRDADGTVDCLEQCPLDAKKTSPGICGCGVAEVDINGNGITDCFVSSELGSKINDALASLAKMRVRERKLTKPGRLALKSFRTALAVIDAIIGSAAGKIATKDSSADIASLAAAVQSTAFAAQKVRSRAFSKNKLAARDALAQLLAALQET